MRLQFVALLVAVLLTLTQAQLSQVDYPQCAVKCATAIYIESSCTSIQCICSNSHMVTNITTCAQATCSIEDQIKTHAIFSSVCKVSSRDDSIRLIVAASVSTGLALLSVIVRFASKWPASRQVLGWDDFIILAAMIFAIPVTILDIIMVRSGLGQDYWATDIYHMLKVIHLVFISQPFYLIVGALIKISILCFYLRIFPSRSFGRICQVFIGICAVFGTTFVLVLVLQCRPISYAWNVWDGSHIGQCINANAVSWTHAAINIVLDLVVMILPLPLLWHLNLSTKKKVHVFLMFGVGTFVTIISILRLRYLVQFANSTNPTWDYLPYALWSTVEIFIGIVCANMPSARAFLRRLLPAWLGGASHTTQEHSAPSRSRITKTVEISTIELQQQDHDAENFIPLEDSESDHVPIIKSPLQSHPHSMSRREAWE